LWQWVASLSSGDVAAAAFDAAALSVTPFANAALPKCRYDWYMVAKELADTLVESLSDGRLLYDQVHTASTDSTVRASSADAKKLVQQLRDEALTCKKDLDDRMALLLPTEAGDGSWLPGYSGKDLLEVDDDGNHLNFLCNLFGASSELLDKCVHSLPFQSTAGGWRVLRAQAQSSYALLHGQRQHSSASESDEKRASPFLNLYE
jgi:hypothetical protein